MCARPRAVHRLIMRMSHRTPVYGDPSCARPVLYTVTERDRFASLPDAKHTPSACADPDAVRACEMTQHYRIKFTVYTTRARKVARPGSTQVTCAAAGRFSSAFRPASLVYILVPSAQFHDAADVKPSGPPGPAPARPRRPTFRFTTASRWSPIRRSCELSCSQFGRGLSIAPHYSSVTRRDFDVGLVAPRASLGRGGAPVYRSDANRTPTAAGCRRYRISRTTDARWVTEGCCR